VGTPDDAVEALEKLWDLTGGFGCLLLSGTNWMDFEATRKSYELFMRYVWPRFCGQNRRRAASMDWMKRADLQRHPRQSRRGCDEAQRNLARPDMHQPQHS
jgi:hypothetical protein